MPDHIRENLTLQTMKVAGLVCAVAVAIAGPAHAGDKIGWLWADQPTSTSPYAPNTAFSYNSASGGITVTRRSKGFYQVDFAGLYTATHGNNVQVTAYNTSGYCTSAGWDAKGSGRSARTWVACFDAGGASADTAFTLLYQARTALFGSASKGLAFVYGGGPATGTYDANTNYSFNSTGGTNTITRVGVGNYTVTIPGLTNGAGDVQVTAYNGYEVKTNPARCNSNGYGDFNGPTSSIAVVQCFDANGVAADELFSVVYSLHEPFAVGTSATKLAAYEYTDYPDETSVYKPLAVTEFNSFGTGRMTSQNVGTGRYIADVPGPLPSTSTSIVLVTVVALDNNYCNVTDWFPIAVACYAQGGSPIDANFDVTYQTSQ